MERRSIFFDEWIKSLREQYKHVIRNNDQVTLPSLTKVLHDVGFTDDELVQLRIQATMHIDKVGEDFVPDLQVLDTTPTAGQPHPSECTCPQCIPIDESQFDEDGQPLTEVDPEEATHETGHVFSVAKVETSNSTEDSALVDVDDDPLTYEDSIQDEMIDSEDEHSVNDDIDEPEDDEDKPKQISMF